MPQPNEELSAGVGLFSDSLDAAMAAAVESELGPPPATTETPPSTAAPSGAPPATDPAAPSAATTSAAPASAPAIDPAAPPPTTPARTYHLRDVFRDGGFDWGEEADDSRIAPEIAELAAAMPRLQALRETLHRYEQHAPAFETWYYQQQSGAAAAPAQPAAAPQTPALVPEKSGANDLLAAWKEPPPLDRKWLEYVERNQHGDIVLKDRYKGTIDPSIPMKVQAALEWEEGRGRAVIRDFPQMAKAAFEAAWQEREEQLLQQFDSRLEEREANRFIEQVVAQYRGEVFVLDEAKRITVDDRGQALYTPFGKLVNHFSADCRGKFYGGKSFEELPASQKMTVMEYALERATAARDAAAARQAAAAATAPNTESPAIAPPGESASAPPAAAAAAEIDPNTPPTGELPPRDPRGRFMANATQHAKNHPPQHAGGNAAAARGQTLSSDDEPFDFDRVYAEEVARHNGRMAKA